MRTASNEKPSSAGKSLWKRNASFFPLRPFIFCKGEGFFFFVQFPELFFR